MTAVLPAPANARWLLPTALLGLLGGGALTFYGFGTMQAPTRPFLQLELIGWVAAALFVLGHLCRRWLRLAVPALAAVAAALVLVACGRALAALVVAALLVAALGYGRRLLPRSAGSGEATLVGLTVLGTAIGLIVPLPINYPGVYTAILLVGVALAHRSARDVVNGWWRDLHAERATTPVALAQAVLGAVLLAHLATALLPERGHDALATHLLVPARIADLHVWDFDVRSFVWAVMPMLGDWLYTIAYMLAGESGSRLTNLTGLLLLTWLVRELARWCGAGRFGATAAMLLLVSTPLAYCESSVQFIDTTWASLTIGGLLAVLRAGTCEQSEQNRNLAIGGLLLGGALAAKAVTFMVLPVVALVVLATARRTLARAALPGLAIATVVGGAIGAVPYVRAWLLTGNPVFPFFNGVFESPLYPQVDFQPPSMFDKGMSWDALFAITFDSDRFLEATDGAAGFQWLLVLLPALLVFVVGRRWRGVALLMIAVAAMWSTFQQTAYLRYVLPSFALAAAAGGVAVCRLSIGSRLAAVAMTAALGVTVFLNLRHLSAATFDGNLDFEALVSAAGRSQHIERLEPVRTCVDVTNAVNPRGNPVPFFCRPFAAGLHAKPLFANWYNGDFYAAVLACDTPERLGELLGERHVKHLIVDGSWQDAACAQSLAIAEPVRSIGSLHVLRLDDRFRFRHERVVQPELAAQGDWFGRDGVVFAPGSVQLQRDAAISQAVPVTAGREYRLQGAFACSDGATAELKIVWRDRGNAFRGQLVERGSDPAGTFRADVVAPLGSVSAILIARAIDGAVTFTRLSLRD